MRDRHRLSNFATFYLHCRIYAVAARARPLYIMLCRIKEISPWMCRNPRRVSRLILNFPNYCQFDSYNVG